ncbi:hypothetical protein CCHR01_06551 [Colletotrichum chrysophilum]|uniref:Mid2 domain-containing protein n=1 Tax=Colletotrichum chrysophilum TaxID=1836956 RepID=A0AAD9AS91_9PEZI|nr:hypothetical protein CCHR01_06551 [Colletotrichum chrysophilum]
MALSVTPFLSASTTDDDTTTFVTATVVKTAVVRLSRSTIVFTLGTDSDLSTAQTTSAETTRVDATTSTPMEATTTTTTTPEPTTTYSSAQSTTSEPNSTTSNLPTTTSKTTSTGIPLATSIGVGVGVALGILLLASIGFFMWYRRRKRRNNMQASAVAETGQADGFRAEKAGINELDGAHTERFWGRAELPAGHRLSELDAGPVSSSTLNAFGRRSEMAADNTLMARGG